MAILGRGGFRGEGAESGMEAPVTLWKSAFSSLKRQKAVHELFFDLLGRRSADLRRSGIGLLEGYQGRSCLVWSVLIFDPSFRLNSGGGRWVMGEGSYCTCTHGVYVLGEEDLVRSPIASSSVLGRNAGQCTPSASRPGESIERGSADVLLSASSRVWITTPCNARGPGSNSRWRRWPR